MNLAVRFLLTFGLVAIVAIALVGVSLREISRNQIERDFSDRLDASARGIEQELAYEALTIHDLLEPLCEHDTFVDKAHLELEKVGGAVDRLDAGVRIGLRHFVPDQAKALHLDELVLVDSGGFILGAADPARVGTRDEKLAVLLKSSAASKTGPVRLRPSGAGETVMETHCAHSSAGITIGLVGARKVTPILVRIGEAYGVKLRVAGPSESPVPVSNSEVSLRMLSLPMLSGLTVVVELRRDKLKQTLTALDRSIAVTGAAVLALAFVIAAALARSLSRPIAALAKETREVVSGEPRPVQARGGGREIKQLAGAFNETIDELMRMKRRLAATERIAARREVARQIAHEIKNPLAPIRAAVETLRRLRMRDDPAFDDYFEEATETVLNEVHRIANIVTEFTKFARLPPPNPEPIDLAAVARGVVTLHAGKEEPRVELVAEPMPMVSADRDQMVQVLTNLVQNGLDAALAIRPDPRVVVTVGPVAQSKDKVRIVVRDNGPGVSEAMIPKLFQPYATTKEKGTGLGLAIVQRIVFEHGGEITYRTAKKGGAVFEIWLPVSGPPLLEKPPGGDGGTERFL